MKGTETLRFIKGGGAAHGHGGVPLVKGTETSRDGIIHSTKEAPRRCPPREGD